MELTLLEANERKSTLKADTNKIRREGRVPGVLYSRHIEPIKVDVEENSIKPLVFTAKTHLISLKLKGREDQECVIKEVQFDPVTDKIIHFDLMALTRGETIEIDIPVQLKGSAIGVKEGGIIQYLLHKLEVECLPKDIPEHIEVDISNLNIGDAIHVEDIKIENVTILNSPESTIVSVVHPKIQEEPVAAEEALDEEAAEPEVISKGKADKEEEEDKEKKEESK